MNDVAASATHAVIGRLAEEAGGLDEVATQVQSIAQTASHVKDRCSAIADSLTELADGVTQSSNTLQQARDRLTHVLGVSEAVIGLIAETGIETSDTKFLKAVVDTAAVIAASFEKAIDSGEIRLDDLFDEKYTPIAGSNPQQMMTRFVAFTDRLLPAIQEPVLALDAKIVFCAAIDRNGFLPTHNRKFSQPQGADVAWNTANCRNRRMFNDRVGLASGRNTKPFLLQTYRRDMGGGAFALMKDASAPIVVKGRHWGGFRMGYKA